MPIQLIDEKERMQLGDMKVDGYQFYIRRLPSPVRNKILNDFTIVDKKGHEHTDSGAAGDAMLKYIIIDWEPGSVVDLNGQPVGRSDDVIEKMPDGIQGKILEEADADMAQTRYDKKNKPGNKQKDPEGDSKN